MYCSNTDILLEPVEFWWYLYYWARTVFVLLRHTRHSTMVVFCLVIILQKIRFSWHDWVFPLFQTNCPIMWQFVFQSKVICTVSRSSSVLPVVPALTLSSHISIIASVYQNTLSITHIVFDKWSIVLATDWAFNHFSICLEVWVFCRICNGEEGLCRIASVANWV